MRRNISCQANINEQSDAKILQHFEAPLEDGASRSSYADVAAFYNVHGEHCSIDQVAKFVCKKTQAFILRLFTRVNDDPIAFACEFRYCIGDGIIEASIERLKFIIRD
jgi:hypothetical protein